MHVRVRRLSSAARDRTSVPARIQARSTRTVAGVIEERAASRSLRRRSDPDRNAYVQQITRRSERHFAGAMARQGCPRHGSALRGLDPRHAFPFSGHYRSVGAVQLREQSRIDHVVRRLNNGDAGRILVRRIQKHVKRLGNNGRGNCQQRG
jgi:hypothetical protein